jgi:flagellar basal body-associated protein FliL
LSDTVTTQIHDDPRNTSGARALKVIVIVLGVLIVLAFAALVLGFVRGLSGHHAAPRSATSGEIGSADYMLPPGARILQVQMASADRIVLTLQTPAGGEVDIFDTDSGHLVGRIRPGK